MKNFLKAFFLGKVEDLVIDLLRGMAKQTTNRIDDQLVDLVIEAIQNKDWTKLAAKIVNKKKK